MSKYPKFYKSRYSSEVLIERLLDYKPFEYYIGDRSKHKTVFENGEYRVNSLTGAIFVKIEKSGNVEIVRIKSQLKLLFWIISIALCLFILAIFLLDKVTINGDSDPSIKNKLLFSFGLLLLIGLVYGQFVHSPEWHSIERLKSHLGLIEIKQQKNETN